MTLMDGFYAIPHFAVSQRVFESSAEHHHKAVEVPQLLGIFVVKHDHPAYDSFFQCQDDAPHLRTFSRQFRAILLHVHQDTGQEEPQLLGVCI